MEKADRLSWRTALIYFTLMASVLGSGMAFGQVEVIEFNASFNEANGCPWVEGLNDCEVSHIDIMTEKEAQKKYKIVVVPTIIVFFDGKEVDRFQANIMMTMEAKLEDVQEAVDTAIMSSF